MTPKPLPPRESSDPGEGRSIPGDAELLRATPLPDSRAALFELRARQAFPGFAGTVEVVLPERWQVWAGVAWPHARSDGDFAGAAALFGERLSGDAPDGLAILLRWRTFRAIDSDGADGLADILDGWRHRLALRRAWFAQEEKSAAYASRLRGSAAGRSVVPFPLSGVDDAEAEYLLQSRVRRGLLLVPADAAAHVLRGGIADPSPLRRAAWAALTARDRWQWPG